MSNYPDGMSHTVERCACWITCERCGREFEAAGYAELGRFWPDEDQRCPHCEDEQSEE